VHGRGTAAHRWVVSWRINQYCTVTHGRHFRVTLTLPVIHTPFIRSSWLDELAWRAGYVLAGGASSMFVRSLLDVCSMFAMFYTPFHDQANVEQTSSRHWANIKQASNRPDGTQLFGSNVGLSLAHSWSRVRPSSYNPPALLISTLITIARRASWMNASKHPADVEQTSSN